MKSARILVINPGSTSTKFAVYDNTVCSLLKTLHHSMAELAPFKRISEQFEFRKNLILSELKHDRIDLDSINIVIGRGGLTYPLKSGVYYINELMVDHCRKGVMGEHASNLGSLIAFDIANLNPGTTALVADPVVTDEMNDLARVSGHPLFQRKSIFHALNQKAVARQHAAKIGKHYEELNLIVVHLGGGITIGAHKNGKVIDVNNGLDGEGPFSPERTGTLPVGALIELCFSGKYSIEDIRAMVNGQGGLVAYLGTNDAREVEIAVNQGDEKSAFYLEAMAYQVSKSIGEMATVLKGNIDGILITGGIAYDRKLMAQIRERVEFIAPVSIYPGQDELKSLAMNALMVARGEVEAFIYDKTAIS
ncbi:MAG: butyrate kinase [Mariniphaga sp.]